MRPSSRGLVRMPWLRIYTALVIAFLYLPLLMVVLFSFNTAAATMFPMRGLTLDWYRAVLSNPVILDAATVSAQVGIVTMLSAGVLGTAAALATRGRSFPGQRLLVPLFRLPLAVPVLILAVTLLTLLTALNIRLSIWTVAIGHTVALVPYVFVIVRTRLVDMDRLIDEAARDLGASPWRTFWLITFPLIRPSIMAAMFIVFAMSFDMFVITLFTIGPQSTLPLVVFAMLRRGIDPSLNAISTLLIVMTTVVLLVASRRARITVAI